MGAWVAVCSVRGGVGAVTTMPGTATVCVGAGAAGVVGAGAGRCGSEALADWAGASEM
jgi:hypothetical protein